MNFNELAELNLPGILGHCTKIREYLESVEQLAHNLIAYRKAEDAGPASKPLIVGQRYAIGDMPIGAKWLSEDGTETCTKTRDDGGVTHFIPDPRPESRNNWLNRTEMRRLLALPSAKADEGKAQTCSPEEIEAAMRKGAATVEMLRAARALNPTSAAPPPLTREEVVEMINKAFRNARVGLWPPYGHSHESELRLVDWGMREGGKHTTLADLVHLVRVALSDGAR